MVRLADGLSTIEGVVAASALLLVGLGLAGGAGARQGPGARGPDYTLVLYDRAGSVVVTADLNVGLGAGGAYVPAPVVAAVPGGIAVRGRGGHPARPSPS